MFARTHFILRNLHNTSKQVLTSSTKLSKVNEKKPEFLCNEPNPVNHNSDHIGKLYILPNNILESLRLKDSMELMLRKQFTAFGKLGVVIRKPAVELIDYFNQTDYKNPINKYVLYGPQGAGKTVTLLHVMHYAYMKNYIILYVAWPHEWLIYPKEVTVSPLHEDMYDLPIHAEKWLRTFKLRNEHLLTKLDLKTTKEYNWSARDKVKSGAPLTELIDFGINRIRYACGVVNAICEEMKIASTENRCRTIVFIDGFNAFFSKYTSVRNDKKMVVPAEKVTLTTAFLNVTKYDWCNGAAVLAVDARAVKEAVESDLPGYLLGTDGFEHLDPFIPLKVDNYTDEEFNNVLDYYENRKWLKPLDSTSRTELKMLSNGSPSHVWQYCARL